MVAMVVATGCSTAVWADLAAVAAGRRRRRRRTGRVWRRRRVWRIGWAEASLLRAAVDALRLAARVLVAPFGAGEDSIGRLAVWVGAQRAAARMAVLVGAGGLRAPRSAAGLRSGCGVGGLALWVVARGAIGHTAVGIRAPPRAARRPGRAFRVGAPLAAVRVARLVAAPRGTAGDDRGRRGRLLAIHVDGRVVEVVAADAVGQTAVGGGLAPRGAARPVRDALGVVTRPALSRVAGLLVAPRGAGRWASGRTHRSGRPNLVTRAAAVLRAAVYARLILALRAAHRFGKKPRVSICGGGRV